MNVSVFYIGQTGGKFKNLFKEQLPSVRVAYAKSNHARQIIKQNHLYSNFETNFQQLHVWLC